MCPVYSCFLDPTHVVAGYRASGDTASMQIRNQISKNNTEQGYLLRVVSLNATMQLVFLPVSL